MQISPVKFQRFNFSSNNNYETKNIYMTKEGQILQKRSPEIRNLIKTVEGLINDGLEDKIFEYDAFVRKLVKYKGTKDGDYVDSNGVIYRCRHNFSTIQIEQNYKGIPYDQNFYYLGYPQGKLPNNSHQTAFIYPSTRKPDAAIEFEFRNYNLDDKHGYTDALISDGKMRYVKTAHDSLSPVKYGYNYQDGKLISADVIVYNKAEYKGKNARLFFDENRKVEKIYYGIKREYGEKEMKIDEVYSVSQDGNLTLDGLDKTVRVKL